VQYDVTIATASMVDIGAHQKAGKGSQPQHRNPSRSQQLNRLYSLPAPLRTFPLPTFVPQNPISLFHLIYTWVSQIIHPPASYPETLHQGWFSPETRSVHVTDPKSIRDLWGQGFYGKGSLSRSEPSWLEREKRRKGVVSSKTSEDVTRNRRAERQQIKWERARKEREAIEKRLSEEQGIFHDPEAPLPEERTNQIQEFFLAPVGPLELLALPNSAKDLPSPTRILASHDSPNNESVNLAQNGHLPSPDLTIVSSTVTLSMLHVQQLDNGKGKDPVVTMNGKANGTTGPNASSAIGNNDPLSTTTDTKQFKYQKSVRFSPTVEKTTFLRSGPPSPDLAATSNTKEDELPLVIRDQEHLQLTTEEAFFLSYGLGVLKVLDPLTKEAISTRDLFSIFRKASYFPLSEPDLVSADDPFMLSYVVYHYFRSLGWVVRSGTKFSVDYLLYNRGPVFSHAEFAIVILPSYSDPYWGSDQRLKTYVAGKQNRSWPWLHCINRVNSQVKKTLVLVYVDIPRPLPKFEDDTLGIDGILKKYKVREMVVKRWLANRTRN
jgi:tRNA-splicing endonuclease subunit Sen2